MLKIKSLASSLSDEEIKLLDINISSIIITLKGHTDFINCLDVLHNGTAIARSLHDKAIKLWRTDDGLKMIT